MKVNGKYRCAHIRTTKREEVKKPTEIKDLKRKYK